MIIYVFKNKNNSKRYVGKTTQKLSDRISQHIYCSKKHTTPFYCALNSYGIDAFEVDVLEQCKTDQQLCEREKYWIKHLETLNKDKGYNLLEGGEENRHSEETKEKIRQIRLGTKRSKKTRKKIGAKSLGRKIKRSLEYIKKLKELRVERVIIKCQLCSKEMRLTPYYAAMRKFCSNTCKGKGKQI